MTPSRAPLPILGKWQSTVVQYSPPAPVPMPQELASSFALLDDGIRYTSEVTYDDGRITHVECVFRFDGNAYPVSGSPFSDEAVFRQINSHTFECRMSLAGKPSLTVRSAVSGDGNRLTGKWELAQPGGTTFTWKTVAERHH